MFQIVPYESVGPLRFGASSAEVTKALGEPSRIHKNRRGEPDYQYDGFSIRLSAKDETVVEVGFTRRVTVRLGDVDIFASPSAFGELITKHESPFEFVGFLILLNLGITLTGFHDNDPAQKAVTAFAKGRWDDVRPRFTRYVPPGR